jgi:ABC-type nitrate/sulfonate/bicarbonate transport system permease component
MGRFLIGAGSTFNMPRLLAGIVFVVFVGLLIIQGAEYLEDRIMGWRHM